MKRKHKRLTFVMIALVLLGIAATLMLNAFEDNIVFFYSPTEIKTKQLKADQRLRLGGLVEEGSLQKPGDSTVIFRVTDTANTITVRFKGILPDLFREGQGVIAEGKMQGETFIAEEVLAKHDENYMPPEVAEAIKKSGQWKDPEGASQ
jgi:cytochrome c-type biogenesis protein CcmE